MDDDIRILYVKNSRQTRDMVRNFVPLNAVSGRILGYFQAGIPHGKLSNINSRFCLIFITLVMMLVIPMSQVIAAGRSVRVGVYQNKPKIFLDENGRPDGFLIDLLKEIAFREKWTLEYVPCEWSACLSALENGQIDLMPDVAYSVERDKIYDFHRIPAAESWSRVYANPLANINRIDQLNGERVAVLGGSIQSTELGQTMQGYGFNIVVVPVASFDEAFNLAKNGSVNAAISNQFFGDYFYQDYGLVRTSITFSAATLYYATAKGQNHDLLDAIDKYLGPWRDDPNSIYYTTLNRWLDRSNRTLEYIAWITGVVLILLILAIGWILLLRRQVQDRTKNLIETNQTLRENEERYRLISTVASDYMFSSRVEADGKLNLKWVAGAFEMITGYTFEEYIAHGGWRAALHPDDYPVDDRDLNKLRSNQNVTSEIRTITKSGETVWVRVYAHPIWDAERKELRGIYGAVQDINERKQIEYEIRNMNTALEQRVVERTAELASAKEAAEAADRIKSAFLATMSHELRTPLNSIIGFTGIMLQGLAGPLNPEQNKQLGFVQNSATHLLELINDVLDISKIEAGQLKLISEKFDLAQSIEKVLQLVTPMANKKHLPIRVQVSPQIGEIMGDRRRVEQVMINLLNNAVKFTEEGYIEVIAQANDHQVVISVCDTGIGIRPEQIEKIFKPFSQVDTGLTRKYEGTGLGLSISKVLVEKMGGSLTLESQWDAELAPYRAQGVGSTFTITLPRGLESNNNEN